MTHHILNIGFVFHIAGIEQVKKIRFVVEDQKERPKENKRQYEKYKRR